MEGADRGQEDGEERLGHCYVLGPAPEPPSPGISCKLAVSPVFPVHSAGGKRLPLAGLGAAEFRPGPTSKLIKLQLRRPVCLSCQAEVWPESVCTLPQPPSCSVNLVAQHPEKHISGAFEVL